MEQGFILNTNIAIYLLHGQLNKDAATFLKKALQQKKRLSIISKIELLCWDEDTQLTEEFINESIIYSMTDEVIKKTIEIRRRYKTKLPDAVIAASAIVFNCMLITRNEKDFSKINGLQVINPFNNS